MSLTEAEATYLTRFFTDNWSSAGLWDDCCVAASMGDSDQTIREWIDADEGAQMALKLGVIDESWLKLLFDQLPEARRKP